MLTRSILLLAALAVASTSLTACATRPEDGRVSKQAVGTVAGGLIGGVLAHDVGKGNTAAIIAGTLLGAWAGSSIGQSLDNADLAMLSSTQQRALESNRDNTASAWQNPNSGNAGRITPTQTFTQGNQPCRRFEQTIIVDGKAESAYGTACRQSNGTWEIQ